MAYKQVEYIQTNQTYLLTNLKTGSLTKYVIDVELVSVTGDNGVMGNAGGTWNSAAFNLMVSDGRREWGVYIAGTPYDHCNYYNIGNRCTVELTKNGITVYDTVLSAYTSNVTFSGNAPTTSTNNIRIGSGIENNSMGVYKFYEVTVFSGNTIVGHYLPYKDETTGYGVLYDSVSNTYLNGYIPSAVTAGPVISVFEVDVTEINATYTGSTSLVTLTADEDMAWTASTLNDWITLSTTGGTGSSIFTVSVAANKAYAARNGLVTLTNGEGVIEITVEQAKYPLLIPNENIYRADLEVVKGYRSGSTINKAYRSGELIYYKLNYTQPTPPSPTETPLTFNIISAGTINWKATAAAVTRTIEYSLNNGDWTQITSTTAGVNINVYAGDNIRFRGDNTTYGSSTRNYNTFGSSTAKFNAYGNVMSLINSEEFSVATQLSAAYTFLGLFKSCASLMDIENLVLPATTLTNSCYYDMFNTCTGITSTPELPATTLAQYCYSGMFAHSINIETFPELPATTLFNNCYQWMFEECTSMLTAPELPATTLAAGCYKGLFSRCNNLSFIKCLATDISAPSCTSNWVYGVSATGTFVTPSSTEWETGTIGIPYGWTRVDA